MGKIEKHQYANRGQQTAVSMPESTSILRLSKKSAYGGLFRQKLKKYSHPGAQAQTVDKTRSTVIFIRKNGEVCKYIRINKMKENRERAC